LTVNVASGDENESAALEIGAAEEVFAPSHIAITRAANSGARSRRFFINILQPLLF
jgi:hypothetical protein